MNVRDMPGRYGRAAGEVGTDLVDAGMLVHAAPATSGALPAEFNDHNLIHSGGIPPACGDTAMADAGWAEADGVFADAADTAGWQGPDRRAAGEGDARQAAWSGIAPWRFGSGPDGSDTAAFTASEAASPAWEAWAPPAGPDPLDPRSVPPAPPLLGVLDRTGIAAAFLQPAPGSDWRPALDAAARAPERLRAVLPLTTLTLPPTLALMARHGLAGLAVPAAAACRPDPALWRSVLLKLAAHGLHLHLQAGPAQWRALLPLVLGHGTPVRVDLPADGLAEAAFAALERRAGHPDLWIGFSPAAVRERGLGARMTRLMAAAGPSRLLWHSGAGTGGFDLDDHVFALLDLFPKADLRQQVCGANARWLAFGTESVGGMDA